jgi:isoquinoline 1-oxidoreductase beta subunit
MNVAYEVASRTGLSPERVTVHTTYLGGGFGRRAEWDFCAEAALVSKAVGRPVQVVWTREDDVRHDFYRPAMRHRMRAALTASGEPRAWHHRVVGPSIVGQRGLRLDVDPTTVEGAVDVPYAFPHLAVETVNADVAVPVGFWRSVGHSHNAFAIECFTDEVAAAAGVDPVDWRRHLLRESPRHLGVLERVAAESSWGELLPTGRARGVALHASFGSFVAVVAEVEEPENGRPRVVRVTAAFDCGRCVHPGIAASQIEGGIVFALTAALHGRIEIAAGGAVQSNFHDYPLLRMDETPAIHVHRVESRAAPGGVGEIAVPPTAPAVANALSALRGERVRSLPLVKSS